MVGIEVEGRIPDDDEGEIEEAVHFEVVENLAALVGGVVSDLVEPPEPLP